MRVTKNASVKISPELYGRVQGLAKERGQSPHAVMLRAIESFVAREEKREALRQAAIEAWEEFQMTGLHATSDEVSEWIESLERKKEIRPKCHV